MIQSVLAQTALQGSLGTTSALRPKGKSRKQEVVADLLLTALIDAFSILVIFLLMSFSSTGEILYVGKGTELPKASQTEILERNTLVRIEEGKIYLENEEVTADVLVARLIEIRQKLAQSADAAEIAGALTVQADRRLKYEFLSQIVQAASHAGFGDIKFAVLVK